MSAKKRNKTNLIGKNVSQPIITFNQIDFMMKEGETRASVWNGVKHDKKATKRWLDTLDVDQLLAGPHTMTVTLKEILRAETIKAIIEGRALTLVSWEQKPGRPTKANGRWTNKRRPCPVCGNGKRMPRSRCARCQAIRGETTAPIPKGPYHGK